MILRAELRFGGEEFSIRVSHLARDNRIIENLNEENEILHRATEIQFRRPRFVISVFTVDVRAEKPCGCFLVRRTEIRDTQHDI